MPNSFKTAGIYDRWLATLGGGEQVAFAYAETLYSLGYKVSLITHQAINKTKAEKKMGVNLDKFELVYLQESSSKELSAITEDYDLFINNSYLDYFPNRSELGILSTFFPTEIYLNPVEYLKRALIVPSFRKLLIYPLRYENFKYDQFIKGRIYKWLDQESSLVFKNNVSSVELSLYFETLSFSVLNQMEILLNDQQIQANNLRLNHRENTVDWTIDLPANKQNKLTIKLPDHVYAQKVALIRLTIPSWRFALYNIFKKYFPQWEMRLHGGPGVTKRDDLDSYQIKLTISEFCRHWIKQYWHLDSQVLYPPVNLDNFSPSNKKKNQIVHVGRFFVTGHSKKQLQLVKQFKKLVDEKKVTDWELHLIGSIQAGSQHQEYFEQVQLEAQGYPVFFHIDIPFKDLKKLLASSKIYWHATGLDADPEKDPILMEHFGITTVEAMASGCVPVVIGQGGQAEIVTPESGFTWKSRKEWLEQTYQLINDPKLLKRLSAGAIKRSKYFSRQNFKERFKKIINAN